jgi:hypothetical protein
MTTTELALGLCRFCSPRGQGAASCFNIGLVIEIGPSVGILFTHFELKALHLCFATNQL